MAPASLEIRSAIAGDADRLAALTTQLGYPSDSPAMAERLRLLASGSSQQVLVALISGEVVGWAQVGRTLTLESGMQAELLGLVVEEAWRGRGVGAALVSAAEAWACGCGLARFRVRTNVTRLATHQFYERLGFRETKRQVVFQKELTG